MAQKQQSGTPNKQGKAHTNSAKGRDKNLNNSGSAVTPARKNDLYAGPTFHHSPAPTKLPPPPFLSSSAPSGGSSLAHSTSLLQFASLSGMPKGQANCGQSMTFEDKSDASPLGFLFRAKEQEEQSQNAFLGSESLTHLLRPSGEAQLGSRHSPDLSVDYTDDDESVFGDFPSPMVTSAQSGADPASTEQAQLAQPKVAKPAWQPVERPPTVPLSQIQQEVEATPTKADTNISKRSKKDAKPAAAGKKTASGPLQTSQQGKTHAKNKQERVEDKTCATNKPNKRKRKNGANAADNAAAPKMILKREPIAGEDESTALPASTTSNKAARQSSASEFKPLKRPSPKASPAPVQAPTILKGPKEPKAARTAENLNDDLNEKTDEEGDARLLAEASNLVKLLSLTPATEQDRPLTPLTSSAAAQQSVIGTPREAHGTPSTDFGGRSIANEVVESALHRMLGLSQNDGGGFSGRPSATASPGEHQQQQQSPQDQADVSLEMDLRKLLRLSA